MTDKFNHSDDCVTYTYSADNTMNGSTGILAQDIGSIDLGTITITDTTSILAGDTITLGPSIYTTNNTSGQWSIGSNGTVKNTLSTSKGTTIDIDELGELVETLKKRLLILTPNFEMHEKYPMLKEMYDEYKAMEKLLSGPDRSPDDE